VKAIKLPSHLFTERPSNSPALDPQVVEIHAIQARINGSTVLSAGLYIERELEHIIGYYLYPPPAVTEQQRFFTDHILASDALTFAHKRRLAIALVDEKQLLVGKARDELDRILRRVMSFRNAFAHGDIVEQPEGTFLRYFEGARKTVELTDDYWDKIAEAFSVAESSLESVKNKLGMPRPGA
jgi:hypothetical protein